MIRYIVWRIADMVLFIPLLIFTLIHLFLYKIDYEAHFSEYDDFEY